MKSKIILVAALLWVPACTQPATNISTASPSSPKPLPSVSPAGISPALPKDGDYDGKGVVTKINLDLGSVEMDHEEIKGVMAAMRMEFYVSDKKMLNGLKVGDAVDFVLRQKGPSETVVKITKAK